MNVADTTAEGTVFELPSFQNGNSQALRLKKSLLDRVPAMANGAVAKVLSDNTVLLVAADQRVDDGSTLDREDDPMMSAFLDFVSCDLARDPSQVVEADAAYFAEFDELLQGVELDD